MKPWKKFYCRTFQTALKIALPFLPYRKPRIIGSVKNIPDILSKKHCGRVLIVTDQGIQKAGLTKRLQKALSESGIPYSIYDKTVANPTTANVEEAMEMYISEGCNAIIGFGGGSSMDCAKALGVRIARPKASLAKMKGILKVHKKLPPSPRQPEPEAKPLWPPSSPMPKQGINTRSTTFRSSPDMPSWIPKSQ